MENIAKIRRYFYLDIEKLMIVMTLRRSQIR